MADTQDKAKPDAAQPNIEAIEKRSQAAYQDCQPLKERLNELYDHVLPYRKPATTAAARSERVDRIFDSTGTKAAFRFAGRMQQDVTPAFQSFFTLKIGPYIDLEDDARKEINEQLETLTRKISAVLEGADFSVASAEMYLDLFGGTGAMLILEHERDIARFAAVPAGEIALRENGTGQVVGIYWEKQFAAQNVPGLWKSANLSDRLKKLVEEKPDELVTIVQASEKNEATGQWSFVAYDKDHVKEGAIYSAVENTCPWLTPRFYKVPGEAMGRGPGLMGLASQKTLNKVTELSIKAAAFAILGLWMYRNDRVFNPKTAKMRPGAMWQVGATGGSMGASIQRLEVPGRFDISNVVLQDLRDNVKQVMLDDTLPPDSGAVRSATEIVERMKRLNQDLAGAYARLVLEIIRPLIQRLIDILYRRKLIEVNLTIDQLITRVEVVSPIARMNQAQDVSSLIEWMQIILSLGGQEMLMLNVRVEDIFTEIARKFGIEEKFMRSKAEKAQIQQQIATMLAAQQQQAQPAPAEPQAPPQPAA